MNVYHGTGAGELYNLEADPGEVIDLWDSPAHQAIKGELLLKSFDAPVLVAMDYGAACVMPY